MTMAECAISRYLLNFSSYSAEPIPSDGFKVLCLCFGSKKTAFGQQVGWSWYKAVS